MSSCIQLSIEECHITGFRENIEARFIKYSKDTIPFPERKETRTSVKKKRTSAMRKIKKKKNKRSIDEEY